MFKMSSVSGGLKTFASEKEQEKKKDYTVFYQHIENVLKRNILKPPYASMLHPHRCFHLCGLIRPLLGTAWAGTDSAWLRSRFAVPVRSGQLKPLYAVWRPFPQQTVWPVTARWAQASQWAKRVQYQHPETEAATWNSAIINLIINTCAFPTATRQNATELNANYRVCRPRVVPSTARPGSNLTSNQPE